METVVAQERLKGRVFFRNCATVMAVVQVSGFAVQLAAGRSSFAAPLIVHAHAVLFMGWIAIFAAQAWLADTAAHRWHRLLGWFALLYAAVMLVLGPLVTLAAVRTERVPFFFQPQHFLLANSLTMVGAFALLVTAIALHKRHDWHPRLQIGAFVLLMGPSFGRLLPMPLLAPYAFEIASLVPLLFVIVGAARDVRAEKRIHPAWLVSAAVLIACLVTARLVAFSPAGEALYATATAGSASAGGDGLAFPPPPHAGP